MASSKRFYRDCIELLVCDYEEDLSDDEFLESIFEQSEILEEDETSGLTVKERKEIIKDVVLSARTH